MSQLGGTYCLTGGHLEEGSLVEHLPEGYSVHMHATGTFSGILLDTFEGHLRKSAQLLLQSPKSLTLLNLLSGDIAQENAAPGWRFAENLPAGEVGSRLLKLSTLRAFNEIAAVSVVHHGITVMDELDKTVVRGRMTMLAHDRTHAFLITPVLLRGYDAECMQFEKALAAYGGSPFHASDDIYGMLGFGQEPYTSKPDLVLERDWDVYDSASRIVTTFIDVARRNEEGILEDGDTEYLHDFRVSLRRVRSLLSLFRNVYAEEDCRNAGREVADIMKQTNRLRDLDVYLLDRGRLYAYVPESMHAGLDTLFEMFAQERKDAFNQVCSFIKSDSYRVSMNDLQHRFDTPDGMARGSAAAEATGHFASRMIIKRYRKVTKLARSITTETPDETVHALRIQCKKLRYLMEFFTPLYPPDAVKPMIKSLKGLQDGLGHFNDCSVQRASLNAFVAEHPLRGKKGMMLAESVGALVATLYQMQQRARSNVDASLGTFANNKTNRAFKALFVNGGAG